MRGFGFAAFAAGVAVGAATVYAVVKKRYEAIAQEEIDSVKAAFSGREDACGSKEEEGDGQEKEQSRRMASRAREKADVTEYASVLRKAGYARKSEKTDPDRPYVITPDEFGEKDGYDQISFTYYADGVLANDADEVIEDAENTVGDALSHFGEYEEDSVFVRCDRLRCDYEILLDRRRYAEVFRVHPKKVEIR